jgi:hypothetical protein
MICKSSPRRCGRPWKSWRQSARWTSCCCSHQPCSATWKATWTKRSNPCRPKLATPSCPASIAATIPYLSLFLFISLSLAEHPFPPLLLWSSRSCSQQPPERRCASLTHRCARPLPSRIVLRFSCPLGSCRLRFTLPFPEFASISSDALCT